MKRDTSGLARTVIAVSLCLGACAGTAGKSELPVETSIGLAGGVAAFENVEVNVPPGALEGEVKITIKKAESHPSGNIGAAYDIDAGGATFAKPVTLVFHLAPAGVPPNVNYEDLRLAWAELGTWKLVEDSKADAKAGTVSGTTDHLSTWGVVQKPECQSAGDCLDGQQCVEGACKTVSCDIWQYISEEDLEAVDQCLADVWELPGGMEEDPLSYYSVISVEGAVFGQDVNVTEALYLAERTDDDKIYTLTLPCDGFTITVSTPMWTLSNTEEGWGHQVIDPETAAELGCEKELVHCDLFLHVEVAWEGLGSQYATDGTVTFRCDPKWCDCGFMGDSLDVIDVEFPDVEGNKQWLKIHSKNVHKDEWLSVVTAAKGESETQILELPDEVGQLFSSPIAMIAYIEETAERGVYLLHPSTMALEPVLTAEDTHATGLAWSPDRTKLAVLADKQDPTTYEILSREVILVSENDGAYETTTLLSSDELALDKAHDLRDLGWNEDGKTIHLLLSSRIPQPCEYTEECSESDAPWESWIKAVDVATGSHSTVVHLETDAAALDFAIAPDGETVALELWPQGNGKAQIAAITLPDGTPEPLLDGVDTAALGTCDGKFVDPAWSPDGKNLAYGIICVREKTYIHWGSDIDTKLTPWNHLDGEMDPAWAPDGSSFIAYVMAIGPAMEDKDLVLIDLETSAMYDITPQGVSFVYEIAW